MDQYAIATDFQYDVFSEETIEVSTHNIKHQATKSDKMLSFEENTTKGNIYQETIELIREEATIGDQSLQSEEEEKTGVYDVKDEIDETNEIDEITTTIEKQPENLVASWLSTDVDTTQSTNSRIFSKIRKSLFCCGSKHKHKTPTKIINIDGRVVEIEVESQC